MWFVNIGIGFLLGCFAATFCIFGALLTFDSRDKEEFIDLYREQWEEFHKGE